MARTDDDTWDLSNSVGATATGVAVGRALASRGPDPLITDPFAVGSTPCTASPGCGAVIEVDPATGKETIIFSCFNQDQPMDRVDFPNLAARLRQNTVQEKLANMWFDHLLRAGQHSRT